MSDFDSRHAQGGMAGGGTHSSPFGAAAAAVGSYSKNNGPDESLAQPQTHHDTSQNGIPRQENGIGAGPQITSTSSNVEVLCGPLLNYKRMSGEHTSDPIWHGSVLIVTTPGANPKQLRLRSIASQSSTSTNGESASSNERSFDGKKLYEDPHKAFWQFSIDTPFQEEETTWEYLIPDLRQGPEVKLKALEEPKRFVVPSKHDSMRIMFHSCNGFSVGTDEDAWSGAALWNDVLRMHAKQPFHVMIGGGDQIYNDSVRVTGPLKPWTDISNPRKRREFPFNEEMRRKCDAFYFNNYIKWYGTEPFSTANAQIPQVNIWDDHDIIDGFGSYTDHFMKCSVFRGIGGVAHKYYLLFQHHIPPPVSTYSTDAPQTAHTTDTTKPVKAQLEDTFVLTNQPEDPSFIIGKRPGPYVEEKSRSIYCQLGKRIAFLGLDARTERTRHQINYPETYDQLFKVASDKLSASNGELKHLIILLGVPIAYPRLQWLENILQSPIIGPIRFLNKRFGLAGGFFNQFDGNVDLLDDLDDHYTARQHKKERKDLIHRLQELSKNHGVRISILSGDVHLAAIGRFFSARKLKIPTEQDWRYMPNIVSSAITNKPPPQAVANLLYRRNKIHHLDHETDETLLEIFDKDPGEIHPDVKNKTSDANNATMPSRNYAIIAESASRSDRAQQNGTSANGTSTTNGNVIANGVNGATPAANGTFEASDNPRRPMHSGEDHAGISHPAAEGLKRTGLAGIDGLDVTLRVEINPSDREGHTQGYGFSFPGLTMPSLKGAINGEAHENGHGHGIHIPGIHHHQR